MSTGTLETVLSAKPRLLSLTASSLLSNEITGLLKDSETNIFEQGEVANFIIELSLKKVCYNIQKETKFT
ncbi:hypothetical protein ACTGX8_07390 [Streptococcus suis]|nr:hypothetical protein [Streptococcus suis]HEM3711569.1 hypothetical protein [Streptococcus suis]